MDLALVITVIIVATAGGAFAERRWRERAEAASDRMLWTVLFALLPLVVFFNVARLEFDADVGIGLVLALIALLSAGGLAWLVGRGRFPRPVVGTLMVSAMAANTGYLGYPMTAIFLGRERIAEAAAYDVLVAVPILVIACFAVGAAFGAEAGEAVRDRMRAFALRNPLLPAFALALVAPDELAPDALVELSQALVFAVLPLGFFVVGVYLAATSPRRFSVPPLGREIALAAGLRLAVAPALLWLLALPLIDLPAPYLLLAAMPCGLNTLVVANAYGLDRRLAAGAIAWSTAIVLAAALIAAVAGA